jgi:hypothetical protein
MSELREALDSKRMPSHTDELERKSIEGVRKTNTGSDAALDIFPILTIHWSCQGISILLTSYPGYQQELPDGQVIQTGRRNRLSSTRDRAVHRTIQHGLYDTWCQLHQPYKMRNIWRPQSNVWTTQNIGCHMHDTLWGTCYVAVRQFLISRTFICNETRGKAHTFQWSTPSSNPFFVPLNISVALM